MSRRAAALRAAWELLQTGALVYAALLLWDEIRKGRTR